MGETAAMEKVEHVTFKRWILTLPWALLRFFGRIVRRFFVAVGVAVALSVAGYVYFEEIVEAIDSRYSAEIDAYLGIDKDEIARLHSEASFH